VPSVDDHPWGIDKPRRVASGSGRVNDLTATGHPAIEPSNRALPRGSIHQGVSEVSVALSTIGGAIQHGDSANVGATPAWVAFVGVPWALPTTTVSVSRDEGKKR